MAYAQSANRGARLSLIARDIESLNDCAQQCRTYGAAVNCYALDVRDAAACQTLLEKIAEHPVDIAIFNAGISGNSVEAKEAWQQQQDIIDTNLMGALACSHALIPSMKTRGSGKLVFISSIAAWRGMGVTPSYCASKAGVKAYADSIRDELARQGVQVQLVMAGFVETDMSQAFAGPRPLMISSATAAEKIVHAIERGKWTITFPWSLGLGMRLLTVLPSRWADAVIRALGYSGRKDG